MLCVAIIFESLEAYGGNGLRHALSIHAGSQTIKHSYPPSYPPSNAVARQAGNDFSVPPGSRGNIGVNGFVSHKRRNPNDYQSFGFLRRSDRTPGGIACPCGKFTNPGDRLQMYVRTAGLAFQDLTTRQPRPARCRRRRRQSGNHPRASHRGLLP